MHVKELLSQEKVPYERIEAPCRYFGACGGCNLQDLRYADQLALKRQRLERLFGELNQPIPPIAIEGLDDPWRYRNKAEFTFGWQEESLALGYHAAGSFLRIVDLEDCHLLPQEAMRVVREVHRLARESGLPPYHPKTHQGFFRFLLIRHSEMTGQVMLCLITTAGHRETVEAMARSVASRHPAVAGVSWGVSERLADVALPDTVSVICGTDVLEDRIGPFRLQITPRSFLQPTNRLADRLYTALGDELGSAPAGVAWDLYCGLGLVTLYLSRTMRKVYGIDIEAEYVESARRHARLNGVTNVEFREGRVEAVLRDRRFWLEEAKPDAIVVDPPRAGLHAEALSGLLAARPKVLAYVSCNPQSLVRDLRELLRSFPRYRVRHVQAFDLFAQTNHVEVLSVLDRVG